jgi:hypothetical protein
VPVTISCREATDTWSRRNEVRAEFTARRVNGEYQTLHLSEAEADAVADAIVPCLSQQGRERLLHSLLRDLSHAKLLRALAFDLRKRVRLPKDR